MRKVLIVEDEDMLRSVYHKILTTEPYDVSVASNGREALALCSATAYDLILLDLMMPVLDGIGFLEQFVQPDSIPTKIILLSNLSSGKELARAMKLGAHKSVLKADLSPRQLLTAVRHEFEA